MGMNFGQAGLVISGKDTGLKKSIDSISSSFDALWSKMGKLAEGAAGLGSRIKSGIGSAVTKGRGVMGTLGNAIDSMTSKALNPKIDNAFSSMYASFHKAWGEMTIGMNMSAKESSRWRSVIGGQALALNADMAQTAQGWAEFRKQGLDLTKVLGGKGMAGGIKMLIKFTSLFGIEGKQLALLTSGLVKGFDFTQEEVRGLIGDVYAMGKAFNVGREAVAALPGIMKVLNEELADFLKGASPKEIDAYTKSIIKMGIAFKEGLGVSMEDGTELAKQLFKTLMAERKNIIDKFRGLGDASLSPLIKGLSEAGSSSEAFGVIMKDLPGFMSGVQKVMEKTRKQGGELSPTFQRLSGTFNKVLGPDATWMAKGNWKKAEGAMSTLDQIAMNTQQNILALTKAVNKAYKSGRTDGDAYNLMLQSQEARLQTLSNPMLYKWIKEQKRGFNTVYGTVEKLAGKKGPLGELTRRMLLVQRVGLSGFFSGMSGLAPVILKTITTMGPLLTALASLGMSMAFIGRLLLPGGLIIAGLAIFNENIRKKMVNAVKTAFEWLSKKVPEYWPKIKKGVVELWYKAIEGVKWLMDVVSPMMSRLADAIGKVDWGGLTKKVIGFISGFFRGVFKAIFSGGAAGALTPDTSTAEGRFMAAGAKLAKAIGYGILQALGAVLGSVWSFFTDWSDGIGPGMEKKGQLLGGMLIVGMFFGPTRTLMLQGVAGMLKVVAYMLAAMLKYFVFHGAAMQYLAATDAAKMIAIQQGKESLSLGMAAKFWAMQKMMAIKEGVMGAWTKVWGWFAATAVGKFLIATAASVQFWITQKILALTNAPIIGSAITFMFGPIGVAIMAGVALALVFIKFKKYVLYIAPVVGAALYLAFGPIGLAIAAIGLLGFAIYSLRDKISGWATGVWQIFKDFSTRVFGSLTWPFEMFLPWILPMVDAFKALFAGDIGGFFANWGKALLSVLIMPFKTSYMAIKLLWEGVTYLFKNASDTVWYYIKLPFDLLLPWVTPVVEAFKALFAGDFLGFFKNMGMALFKVLTWPFQQVWTVLKLLARWFPDTFGPVVQWFKDAGHVIYMYLTFPFRMLWKLAGIVVDAVVSYFTMLWGNLKTIASGIYEIVTWPWRMLATVAGIVWDEIKGPVMTFVGWAKATFGIIWDIISWPWRMLSGVASAAWEGIKGIWGTVSGWFSEVWDGIVSGASAAWEKVKGIAASAWEGIKGAASSAWDTVKGAASTAWGGIKSAASTAHAYIMNEEKVSLDASLASVMKQAQASMDLANKKIEASKLAATAQQSDARNTSMVANTAATATATHAQLVNGQIQQSSATTTATLSQNAVAGSTNTQTAYAGMPVFFGSMYGQVAGTSAKANVAMATHGQKASKSTAETWGESGQFVNKTWTTVGGNMLEMWDGIAKGAFAAGGAIVTSTMAAAKATDQSKAALERMRQAQKDLEDAQEKRRLKQQRQMRSELDLVRMASKMGIQGTPEDIRKKVKEGLASTEGTGYLNVQELARKYATEMAMKQARKAGGAGTEGAGAGFKVSPDMQRAAYQRAKYEVALRGLAYDKAQKDVDAELAKKGFKPTEAGYGELRAREIMRRREELLKGQGGGMGGFGGGGGPLDLKGIGTGGTQMKVRVGQPGAGVTGVSPGVQRTVDKREVVDKQLSKDTKTAMTDISVQMNQLAAAIRDISDFKIVVTGDVGKFLTAVKKKMGGRVGATSPSDY